jgi:hypothetical protein
MKLMPQGDYYAWDCDWCDSHNMTLWTRIDEENVVCGVCYSRFPISFTSAVGNGTISPAMRKCA